MPAPRIDQATVERMLLAYIKDPNPTFVAKACGVTWETAKKYIQIGAPALGIGPFATEARRILRNGDKIVRLTEVTKQVRYQVEERDLGAFQDLLFQFEATTHECLSLVRARAAREKEYFAKCDDQHAKGATEEMIGKIKKPPAMNMQDLKAIGHALHELISLKREFWDRMEVVQRTEVEITTPGSTAAEGIADAAPPPLDFTNWQPNEIAAYVDSIDDGDDPVYPAWMTITGPGILQAPAEKSAKVNPDKTSPEEQGQDDSVLFPPVGPETNSGPDDE